MGECKLHVSTFATTSVALPTGGTTNVMRMGPARSNSSRATCMAQLAATTVPCFVAAFVLQASMEVAADRRREVEQLRQQLAGSETVLQGQRGKQLGVACTVLAIVSC